MESANAETNSTKEKYWRSWFLFHVLYRFTPCHPYVLSTFSLFNSILYTFDPPHVPWQLHGAQDHPLVQGCSATSARPEGTQTNDVLLHDFLILLTILYTFSVFLDEILRKFFTRSLSLSILYLCSFGCRSFLLCLNIPTTLRRCFFTLRCCGLLKQWVVTHLLKPFSMLDGSWGADDRIDWSQSSNADLWVQDSTRPENVQPCRALLCFFETFMSDHAASMVFNHTHTLWTSKGFTWQHW